MLKGHTERQTYIQFYIYTYIDNHPTFTSRSTSYLFMCMLLLIAKEPHWYNGENTTIPDRGWPIK